MDNERWLELYQRLDAAVRRLRAQGRDVTAIRVWRRWLAWEERQP